MKKISFIILGLIAVIIGFTFYSKIKETRSHVNTADNKMLVVGTAAEFPPFEYIENDTIVGFDIDLITTIAEKLGKELQIKDMQFSALIPQLQTGAIQLIAAGLTPTEQRAKQVLFTTPYLEGEPLVMVSKNTDPIKSLDQLHNKMVVVNEGFSADLYMSKMYDEHHDFQLKRLATVADAFLALKAGNADVFVTAKNTLKPFFKQYSKDEFYVHELEGTNEPAAFAGAYDERALIEKINTVLEQLKTDGSLDALKKKWDI